MNDKKLEKIGKVTLENPRDAVRLPHAKVDRINGDEIRLLPAGLIVDVAAKAGRSICRRGKRGSKCSNREYGGCSHLISEARL